MGFPHDPEFIVLWNYLCNTNALVLFCIWASDNYNCEGEFLYFLAGLTKKPLVVEARANARKESAKIRNRRMQKKVCLLTFLLSLCCFFNLLTYSSVLTKLLCLWHDLGLMGTKWSCLYDKAYHPIFLISLKSQ